MKKYVTLAAAALALASCTSDEFVGNNANKNELGKEISFNSASFAITRATQTGKDAATLLNNNMVVEGVKGNGTTKEVVFDHYNVNFVENTANTTNSNTNNWEYVAQAKHDLASISAQSIKYWDYSASQYDFIAYSAGKADAVYTGTPTATQVLYTAITPATLTTSAYTVKGKAAELAKVYIADMVTSYVATDYQKPVQFNFRSLSAKVRIGLYETVPGYSIQASSVKFYTDDANKDNTGASHLYTKGTDVFNDEGTYTVYYPTVGESNKSNPDYNKAHVKFTAEASGTSHVKAFGNLKGSLAAEEFAAEEVAEAAGKSYLGRSSNAATFAGEKSANYYTLVIPNETGAQLNLKVDYTLISTDGSGEVINVTGAMAQVPAAYASWQSGYAYTYLFKISQNTNGLTNPSAGPAGLYPITFDAITTETEDGVQETITTVATPSITTYAKGAVVTANDEYTVSSNIYAVVENGTALTVGTNANLYTVTLEAGAAQTINEASVANAIKNGGAASPFVVTDANGKKMTVTAASGLTAVTEIAAADSPTGTAITVNGAKFTPSAAGIYAFEYINGTNKYYKIIKVQ